MAGPRPRTPLFSLPLGATAFGRTDHITASHGVHHQPEANSSNTKFSRRQANAWILPERVWDFRELGALTAK